MRKGILTLLLGWLSFALHAQQATLSGHLTDAKDGEALIGASVMATDLKEGTATNAYGFYSLTLPVGKVKVVFQYVGYAPQERIIELQKDQTLDLRLQPTETALEEVVVSARQNEERQAITSTQMSTVRISPAQIRNIPALGGEADLIKVMQLMPGVKRGGEGQTGMFVRGGGADQNLIILDEAPVYNVSHLFGFFSVFNNDAVKDVTMTKGGFPASYGGRISSIMDIRMKEGNQERFSTEGGVGLLSTRLTVQGPLVKDKSSFLISGRRSYIAQTMRLNNLDIPYYFYDLNAKFNYKLSDRDRLYYSAYFGNDVLSEPKKKSGEDNGADKNLGLDFGFVLGNMTSTVRWNRQINPKLFSNLSLIYTRFKYDVNGKFDGNSIFVGSKIRDLGLKLDYDYYLSPRHQLKYGMVLTQHVFKPNVVSAKGDITESIKNNGGTRIMPQEVAAFALDDWKVTDKLTVNYGMRVSGLGAKSKTYFGPEPRVAATYAFSEKQSVKLGLSRMYQYMHLVSSSSVALPTDLWYPVTDRVKPQVADQIAAGYNVHLEKLNSLLTVEAYYKGMQNLIEYKEGAVLLLNDDYESELLEGRGRAYGMEVFLQKSKGRFTGWAGYSLSWSARQFDGLNQGKWFYAKYDRRHDISLVGSYEISKRLAVSAVWVYATGQRFTGRIGQFGMPDPSYTNVDLLPVYTERNALKFSSSHRLDMNLVIKNKPGSRWESEWHIGAYNVYNRAQPYKVNVVSDGKGGYKYQQVGLFGFIPSVAYNFKF